MRNLTLSVLFGVLTFILCHLSGATIEWTEIDYASAEETERLQGAIMSSVSLARPITLRVIPLTVADALAMPGVILPDGTEALDPAESKSHNSPH